MVQVINIRNAPQGWQNDPRYVYIGRAGWGLDGTFGNPFHLTNENQREEIIFRYKSWFIEQVKNNQGFRNALGYIRPNSILVCFCKPKACHGDVIAAYLNDK